MTACRTRVSSPIVRTASRSPCRGGAVCQSRHHVRGTIFGLTCLRNNCFFEVSCFSICPCKINSDLVFILKALLQHQRERKDLLARELKRGKERLRGMQTQVQTLKMELARVAARPLILSKVVLF